MARTSRRRAAPAAGRCLPGRRVRAGAGARAGLAAAAILFAAAAGGEIYRYTDDRGRLHFVEDLTRVPPRYRDRARPATGGAGEPSRYQRISEGGGSRSPAPGASPPPASLGAPLGAPFGAPSGSGYASPAPGGDRPVRVRVHRAGTAMLVQVRLDGRVVAPFLIDTGASDVVIPAAVAHELGLPESGRTQVYRTANGLVEHPVVMLRSVELGGAMARDVPASVSPTMEVGLLGLSFFNRFTYQIDAAAGVVTLIPNDLEARGLIRGGRSEAQWRAEYRSLHARLRDIAEERQRTPDSRGRKHRDLDDAEEALRKQLAVLDAEADRARVPLAWRN